MTSEENNKLANSGIWTIEAMFQYFSDSLNLRDAQLEQRFADHERMNTASLKNIIDLIQLQKDHMTHNFTEQRQAVLAALAAADRSIAKAETANEKRFEAVNEFRETLADQQRSLIPRTEAEGRFSAMSEKILDISDRVKTSEGRRGGGSSMLGYIIGAFGLLLTILSIISMFRK